MRHFDFMLSIARGFAVPEQEQRQAAADAVAGRRNEADLQREATARGRRKPESTPDPDETIASYFDASRFAK